MLPNERAEEVVSLCIGANVYMSVFRVSSCHMHDILAWLPISKFLSFSFLICRHSMESRPCVSCSWVTFVRLGGGLQVWVFRNDTAMTPGHHAGGISHPHCSKSDFISLRHMISSRSPPRMLLYLASHQLCQWWLFSFFLSIGAGSALVLPSLIAGGRRRWGEAVIFASGIVLAESRGSAMGKELAGRRFAAGRLNIWCSWKAVRARILTLPQPPWTRCSEGMGLLAVKSY